MSGKETTSKQQEFDEQWCLSLFEDNPLPMWIYDAETLRFLAVNDATIQKYGYTREEFLTMTLRDIRPESELSKLEKHLSQNDQDFRQSGVWTHKAKDGKRHLVEIASHSTRFHDRPAWIVTVNDVTIRQKLQQGLRESEERLQNLFDNAAIGMYRATSEGHILACNAVASRMLGFKSLDEMKGMNLGSTGLGPTYDRKEFCDRLEREGTVIGLESTWIRRDGVAIRVRESASVARDHLGKMLYYDGTMEDITVQRRAEEALEESERRFHELFDKAPVGYHELDAEGRVVRVNRTELDMLGYSSEEMVGHFVWDFAQDHELSKTNVLKKLSGKQPSGKAYERAYCRKDGSVIHFLVQEYYLYGHNRQVVGIRTALEDITEKKKAEDALKEVEARYRDLFQDITIGVYRTTPSGKILFVNPALARMLGYDSPEELAHKIVDEDFFEVENTRGRFKEIVERDGQVVGMETRWRRKDGTSLWIRENARVVKDGNGQSLYYEGTAEDVTYRKEMEQALRQSEEQYRSFFEEDPTGDFLTLPDGIITACNPGFLKMFGFKSQEDALSTNVSDLYPKKGMWDELLNLLRQKGKLTGYEVELRKQDGSPVFATATYVGVFDEQSKLVRVKQYLMDETERKLLERQLFQAQKLEGIGRLAGGVAHDYNNILGVVLGYGELVKKKLKEGDPVYHQVEAILKAANRGSELTRQLLAFARREIVSPKVLNLGSTVQAVRPMLQRLIGENINLAVQAHEDLWNTKIDPTQFEQIVFNLATNSRDAIGNVGTLTIEVYNESIDEQYIQGHREFSPGEYVVLSVTDDGKGMDSDTQEKIFEPFFTTKPKGEGSGLGLSTVYGIVKQNGGNVNVYSEPDKGTTLRVYFPRFYGKKEISEERMQDESLSGDETILVVEDQADLLELAKNSLEEYGYKVLGAWTPAEAIKTCEEYSGKIDMLLSDVIMPKMNGKELRDAIINVNPGIKTLFMSGYTANVIAHQGILDEGIEFIQKPFTPRTLARKVRDVLQTSAKK